MKEFEDVSNHQIEWCDRLWTSLKIDASWTLPSVGIYVKTGTYELTLNELFFSKPTPDAFGMNAFDTHDWVIYVAGLLNWNVKTEIVKAHDWDGNEVEMWDSSRVGEVDVCSKKCGAVIRIEPYVAGNHYTQIDDKGVCPCCDQIGFESQWFNCWVVVDDRAARLKIENSWKEEE